mmetsp:Transcript_16430/g.38071  ORF Transcript_16430/g.38071 Transcript_16430/m.38071 type:complete len:773 (-) Transcript_16430:3535-5853(-)
MSSAEKISHDDDNDIGGDVLGLISAFIGRAEASASGGGQQHGRHRVGPHRACHQTVEGREIAAKLSTDSRVIVFSKDRPWQLQQLLKSLHLHDDAIEVFVILKWSNMAFERGYKKVMQGQDKVNYLVEGGGNSSFSTLLYQALNHGDRGEIVMFLTDDCLLLEPIACIMASAAIALQRHKTGKRRVFNFLTRLHPGISYCQTRNLASPSPRNALRYVSNGKICCYDRALSSGEFAYMFDVSGGVYRLGDVIEMVSYLDNQDTCHPNILESRANQILKSNSLQHLTDQLSAIPSRPSLVILTVNRVQDIYNAPIASDESVSPEALLQYLERGEELDVERYTSRLYDASHIGDLHLKERGETGAQAIDLSVLIPVHRGPAKYASHAMASIVMQPIEELLLSSSRNSLSLQIVIVDDRCRDGSVEAMMETTKQIAQTHSCINLVIDDKRPASTSKIWKRPASPDCKAAIIISVDVFPSPRPGIACALNHGLDMCKSDLVARMDCDDVAAPGRLIRQARFLMANQSLSVVGTSAVLFSSTNDLDCDQLELPYREYVVNRDSHRVLRSNITVSDPGVLSWCMLFSCALAHPSVMFRKRAVQDAGGYDENNARSEDYQLWLQVSAENPRAMATLPFVGLYHRKHSGSNSSRGANVQKDESNHASLQAMKHLLERADLDVTSVSVLRDPQQSDSPQDIDLAAELLESLEQTFVAKHGYGLTKNEIDLIRIDCDERIAQLSMRAFTVLGRNVVEKSKVWAMWCRRTPDGQLERLSLLCKA